ncbi:LOW QUALITY PROTEIN: hypothetical protein SETIT_9G470900v2 [Setaria italica]|uniref:CCHC-type domain-containing protein n=2 Tax=Setaria italica TaxID=4555 RepID=A0A368STD9_SETIT|nr:LOW QUALITY PROTEIN: hypothetical protein SETIT_9G470900v2 [Setaria italica]
MAAINKTEFKVLELNGKNYQTWALDCEFHLKVMQLTSTIARPGAGVPAPLLHEKAKVCIFLRHHIHPDLKMEYLEVRDPLVLWLKLQERFGKRDWAQLRFVDFKTVELRFCGQVVTELEMIEKTLETFHPTNMQQYRNNKYIKYCDLINNELLMKNFNMRPAGTQAQPEAHASFRNNKGKGPCRNKGQKYHGQQGSKGGKFKKYMNGGQKHNGNGKNKSLKGSKGDANGAKHSNVGCFRCGSQKHWSRTCTAEPHFIKLYQEWKKRQNPEAHFIQAFVDAQTGLHFPEPPDPPKNLESAAMDVDPISNSDATTTGGDAHVGDEDYDLDDEDLLDVE